MMEVLSNQDIPINAMVCVIISIHFLKKKQFFLACSMIVHRRCRSKVGNYCGCQGKSLELYEKWRENV
jgi:hypothetical protein